MYVSNCVLFFLFGIVLTSGSSTKDEKKLIIPAKLKDVSYQAAFEIFDVLQNNTKVFCSGVIVSKNIILTSRYCAFESYNSGINTTVIRVGSKKIGDGGKAHTIQNIYYHPEFDFNNNPTILSPYHIVAVEVKEQLKCANCRPLKLAGRNTEQLKVNTTLRIPSEIYNDSFLQTLEFEITDEEPCRNRIQNIWTNSNPPDVLLNQKCALLQHEYNNESNEKSCDLRSSWGAPVMVNEKLVGIIETIDLCARGSVPALFVKIDLIYDWLAKLIYKDNSCSS